MKLNGHTIYGAAIAVITLVAFTELAYAEEYTMEQKVCAINTLGGYAVANAIEEAKNNPDDEGKQMAAVLAPAFVGGYLSKMMLADDFDWTPLQEFVKKVKDGLDEDAELDNGFMTLEMGEALIATCQFN